MVMSLVSAIVCEFFVHNEKIVTPPRQSQMVAGMLSIGHESMKTIMKTTY